MAKSLQEEAREFLLALEKKHLHCVVDWQHQVPQGESGAIYFGHFKDLPVAFKYFSSPTSRENEERALRHFSPHGLSPNCLGSFGDRLLAIEKLPGGTMHISSEEDLKAKGALWIATCAELGKRLQRMSALSAPPSDLIAFDPDGDERTWLRHRADEFVEGTIKKFSNFATERALEMSVFRRFLDLPLAAVPLLKNQPACWNYWDINTGNMLEEGGIFQGLIDFESCRLGTWIQQLAAGLFGFRRMSEPWKKLYAAFTQEMGRSLDAEELKAVLAMAYVEVWWYLKRQPVNSEGNITFNNMPFSVFAKLNFDWCDDRIQDVHK